MYAALVLSACSVVPSAFCDLRPTGEARCQERLNSVSGETFKGTCATAMGLSGDGECPKADQVGGCDLGMQGDGATLHDWYYPPTTPAEIMTLCANAGASFLAAPTQ